MTYIAMVWKILLYEDFEEEFLELPESVQDQIAIRSVLLKEHGPRLGRPYVDTLKNSKHTNMKELRFNIGDSVWRIAFAFDTKRQAILLVAGDKAGKNKDRFYKDLIRRADNRFSEWEER